MPNFCRMYPLEVAKARHPTPNEPLSAIQLYSMPTPGPRLLKLRQIENTKCNCNQNQAKVQNKTRNAFNWCMTIHVYEGKGRSVQQQTPHMQSSWHVLMFNQPQWVTQPPHGLWITTNTADFPAQYWSNPIWPSVVKVRKEPALHNQSKTKQ